MGGDGNAVATLILVNNPPKCLAVSYFLRNFAA